MSSVIHHIYYKIIYNNIYNLLLFPYNKSVDRWAQSAIRSGAPADDNSVNPSTQRGERPLFYIRGDKMDWTQAVETIFSIIGQNAFPIVCCVYLLYDKRRSDDQHKQEIDDLRDTMTTALNNNTLALQKIIDKLG